MSEPFVDVTGARRRRARRRLLRRLRFVGILLGVAGLVGGGFWLVWGSSWFTLTQVEVTGTALTTPDEVLAAAAVPLGGPLAGVDTRAVADRVGTIPAVDHADVRRAWPHTLTVAVTERRAVLALELGSSYVWVDAGGTSFHVTDERPVDVVVVDAPAADADLLAQIATVIGQLPPAVRERTRHIEASSVDSIVVVLTDRRRIIWGSSESSELKAQVIVPLLEVAASTYDVSAPSHPTTR